MWTIEITEALRKCELFAILSEAEIQEVAALCQVESYETDEVIYRQGVRSEKLYVIVEGSVVLKRTIKLEDMETVVAIDDLAAGRAFGWRALMEPRVYTLSAVCSKPTRVLAVDGTGLRFFIEKEPSVGLEVMTRFATLLGDRLVASYRAFESCLLGLRLK